MKTIELKTRKEWRAWLNANHANAKEIWLVFFKAKSGKQSIKYEDSVEEALCFGWVDSLIKKLDENKYARKFTPRKNDSNWSEVNKKRVSKIIREGLMTENGQKLVDAAKQTGRWYKQEKKPELTYIMPDDFLESLNQDKKAMETYEGLSVTQKKQYLGWIEIAKKKETRQRRIKESIQLLAEGKKLGLK